MDKNVKDIYDQIVAIVRDEIARRSTKDRWGTATSASSDGSVEVLIDGGEESAPAQTVTNVHVGDRVLLAVDANDRIATVKGNYTDPAASDSEVKVAVSKADLASKAADDAVAASTTASEAASQAVIDAASAKQQASQAAIDAASAAQSAKDAAEDADAAEQSALKAAADAESAADSAEAAEGDAKDAADAATAAKESAKEASDAATSAEGYASEASDSASAAAISAGKASDSASEASGYASTAQQQAEQATKDANTAKQNAATALAQAGEAKTAANEAQASATSAALSATNALTQLSFVEDVAGTLQWIQDNCTFTRTGDTEVDTSKVYFTLVSGDYVPVIPDGTENPKSEGWYELTNLEQSQRDYIMAHLAVTSAGLWILPSGTLEYVQTTDATMQSGTTYYERSGSEGAYVYTVTRDTAFDSTKTYYERASQTATGYKLLLSSTGAYIYDASGNLVRSDTSEGTRFAQGNDWYLGSDTAYIAYDASEGTITVSSAVKFGSSKTLSELLADVEQAQEDIAESQSMNGWSLVVSSSAPDITGGGSVTLSATVYKDGEECDAPIGAAIKWYLDGSVVGYGSAYTASADGRYTCRLEV